MILMTFDVSCLFRSGVIIWPTPKLSEFRSLLHHWKVDWTPPGSQNTVRSRLHGLIFQVALLLPQLMLHHQPHRLLHCGVAGGVGSLQHRTGASPGRFRPRRPAQKPKVLVQGGERWPPLDRRSGPV